ncbi:hypothetical protein M3147_06275 [Agromyces mediolanus]|uniref:hypothetical protein n=1 Tax=Agromyces mediolanus TaxID=41986 RepID=UPI00204207DC|nr:hypothetical protein [Agromyces mediolanus]MCM3656857.1 hypothetical protein [Agromyces mediolanus]
MKSLASAPYERRSWHRAADWAATLVLVAVLGVAAVVLSAMSALLPLMSLALAFIGSSRG